MLHTQIGERVKVLVGLSTCKGTIVNWCHLCVAVARYGSAWHVARTEIVSSYRAFSREKIEAELGAYIGLGHVNVTLRGKPLTAAKLTELALGWTKLTFSS
jgi:hypothetical protein